MSENGGQCDYTNRLLIAYEDLELGQRFFG